MITHKLRRILIKSSLIYVRCCPVHDFLPYLWLHSVKIVHISFNMTLVILMRKPSPWFLVIPRTKSKESTLNLSRAIKKQPRVEK